MVHLSNDNNSKTMKGILICECSKCNKKAAYEMSEEETKTYMLYQIKGRSMGTLTDLFPNIPAWILSGAIDPLANGKCICPKCQK